MCAKFSEVFQYLLPSSDAKCRNAKFQFTRGAVWRKRTQYSRLSEITELMDNWYFSSSGFTLEVMYAVSGERAACTLWKDDCSRVCTTAVRLSLLLVPVNVADSDHSTGWTYRGRFPGDNAVGPWSWLLSHLVQRNGATPFTPLWLHGKNKDYFLPAMHMVGRDSSVCIATRYGLDGPGIESRWGRHFPHPSIPALGPTQPPIQWVPGLSVGKTCRGVALAIHPI